MILLALRLLNSPPLAKVPMPNKRMPSTTKQAIAAKMKPFGYSFTPTDLGSKLNAIERVGDGWRGAADPRGPGTSSVDGAPAQN